MIMSIQLFENPTCEPITITKIYDCMKALEDNLETKEFEKNMSEVEI